MNAQDIILGQLEREKQSHNITREVLREYRVRLWLQAKREMEFPLWRRKLLAWVRGDNEQ